MIRKLLTTIFPALAMVLMTGCNADEPFVMTGADGNTTINLLIPSAEMAYANTRAIHDAQSDRLADEAKIHNLAVIGFYGEGEGRKHFFAELTQDMSTEVQDVYRSYKLSVVPGDYDLYVLANCSGDLDTIKDELESDSPETMTVAQLETKIKELPHIYYSGSPALPAAATGLPMAGTVSCDVSQDQTKQVVVDLKFICAKARVTVIYADDDKDLSLGVDVKNAYPKATRCFSSGNADGTPADISNAGSGLYYALSGYPQELNGKKITDLDYWTYRNTDLKDDAVNKLTNGQTESLNKNYAYQNTLYLSECSGKGANQTYLMLTGSDGTGARINIGCDATPSDHDDNAGGTITRGHFYDIVAKVAAGKITYEWDVKSWTVKDITVSLAGVSRLFLDKTEIDYISGEEPVEIYYESDAPSLTFESCKVDADGNIVKEGGKDLFVLTENPSTGMIEVNVSSETGIVDKELEWSESKKYGFWVVSGSIRKWVDVKNIDLKLFLRILPDQNNVMVRNIVNQNSYYTDFAYATNDDGLHITIDAYTNTNTRTKNASGEIQEYILDENGKVTRGVYFQVFTAGENPTAITPRTALKKNLKIGTDTGFSNGFTTLPKSGVIRVYVYDPTSPAYFSKEIKANFHATTTNNKTDDGELIISPNPTVYTIHFKAINETWTDPHIYVYQPLYYNGYPVYDNTYDNNQPRAINWLEYTFTGNRAFKGWVKDGGDVADLTIGLNSNIIDGGGSKVVGYQISNDSWGAANVASSFEGNDNARYHAVDLIDYKQSKCITCKGGSLNTLFPGMGMTEEEDGWWKIELPLLAKPDLAMIMFNDGHDSNNAGRRYPGWGVPGLPLPNYSDREAWYLYDASRGGDKCSFSDDRRDTYTSNSGGGSGGTQTPKYYIVGTMNEWKESADYELTSTDNTIYTLNLSVEFDQQFLLKKKVGDKETYIKAATSSYNDPYWIQSKDSEAPCWEDEGNNFRIRFSSGYYKIVYNVGTQKLKFTNP